MTDSIRPQTILDFWFTEIDSKLWWAKSAAFDALITERFGRYPHRNAILGRVTTEAELVFLQEVDSAF